MKIESTNKNYGAKEESSTKNTKKIDQRTKIDCRDATEEKKKNSYKPFWIVTTFPAREKARDTIL
jgi:hypothetical protein